MSLKRPWQTRFDVTPSDTVTLGDLQFGTDVKVRFGELGAYHVNLPMAGSLTWRQGRTGPLQATTRTAASSSGSVTPPSRSGMATAGCWP
ncbi:hypothetical protein AB0M20_28730 [Actinoplanes sp. NPDC051633]|uniref:AraC-like ligand-binding domain-containing protein n=1 Tax=Actinoplanes sp. NPDC051633 TaxID=3155670 RepID=UPI003430FE4B